VGKNLEANFNYGYERKCSSSETQDLLPLLRRQSSVTLRPRGGPVGLLSRLRYPAQGCTSAARRDSRHTVRDVVDGRRAPREEGFPVGAP
jgi:hypothetical protein